MKLNNKGFAITAVLYGLLILFVILVSSYLLVLSAKKDRIDDLVNEIENNYTKEDTSNKTIAEHISNLYNSAQKTIVTNKNIQYSYAPAVSMMNDRFGGTTSNYNIGNIRYYGSDPNNYIYFNCSDYNYQSSSTCELWRILGVFDGKVKIIRLTPLSYKYDENGSNNWATSSLNTYLNSGYYNNLKNASTRNLIHKSIWYLGGYTDYDNCYPSDAYYAETHNIVGTTVYNGNPFFVEEKIGLITVSDFMYTTDLNYCKESYNYNGFLNGHCYGNSWLNFYNGWILTPMPDSDEGVIMIESDGNIGYIYSPNWNKNVYPVLSIITNVSYLSGDGSLSNPYKVSNLK